MRSLFVISGEDLVRALVRAGFHLTSAGGGVASLRREAREVEVPLLPLVEEPVIERILAAADIRPLELVGLLSLVEDEARWRAAQQAAERSLAAARKKPGVGSA